MIRRPPRSTLFPSTPLSRSHAVARRHARHVNGVVNRDPKAGGFEMLDPFLAAAAGRGLVHDDVGRRRRSRDGERSEEHTSELQSRPHLVCRLLLEKKKKKHK